MDIIGGTIGVGPGKSGTDFFLVVLGVVLESPNATVVAFSDMACGKPGYLAGTSCIGQIFVIIMFIQGRFGFLCSVFSFWCMRWKLVFWGIGS